MGIWKSHPLISLINGYLVDSPQPFDIIEFSLLAVNENLLLMDFAFSLEDNLFYSCFLFALLGSAVILAILILKAEPATTSSSEQVQESPVKVGYEDKNSNRGQVDIVWCRVKAGTFFYPIDSQDIIGDPVAAREEKKFFYNTKSVLGDHIHNLPSSSHAIYACLPINGIPTNGYIMNRPENVIRGYGDPDSDKRLGVKWNKFQSINRTHLITSLNVPVQPDPKGDLHIGFSGDNI